MEEEEEEEEGRTNKRQQGLYVSPPTSHQFECLLLSLSSERGRYTITQEREGARRKKAKRTLQANNEIK